MKKSDIDNKESVVVLVDSFYDKVNKDELLAPIFNEVVGVDWDHHLPRMYDFWNTVLFGKGDYKGSPFAKHRPLPIYKRHFDRWLALFNETIDEHFEGPLSDDLKMRAYSIAYAFQSKLKHLRQVD